MRLKLKELEKRMRRLAKNNESNENKNKLQKRYMRNWFLYNPDPRQQQKGMNDPRVYMIGTVPSASVPHSSLNN